MTYLNVFSISFHPPSSKQVLRCCFLILFWKYRSSQQAILLKYVFFFSRSDKEISRVHQNFQESFPKIVQKHKIFQKENTIRTDETFQESCLKSLKEHIRFLGDHTPKNRYFAKLPRRRLSKITYNLFISLFITCKGSKGRTRPSKIKLECQRLNSVWLN